MKSQDMVESVTEAKYTIMTRYDVGLLFESNTPPLGPLSYSF